MKRKSSGFTLIELLVVIAIIAVMATIGALIYTGFQKNARDAKRKVDIDAIASAMESNYGQVNSNQYTTLTPQMFTSGNVPQDPLNTNLSPDNVCPGVCKYCVFEGATHQPHAACTEANTKVVTAGTEPAGGSTSPHWTVCANLESGGFTCRSSGR
jgi:prepilin-type N-terminal cleavage/methylation domain-containing protein